MDSLKVLISAYACRPGKGSEPGVGWQMVQQMAKYHKICVVTRAENRPVIEAAGILASSHRIQFHYYNVPRWERRWKWEGIASQLHYYAWQLGAYRWMKRLHQAMNFDLTHHITYVRYWNPSMLAFIPAPFVWGPVGGADLTPKGFTNDYSSRGKILDRLRRYSHHIGEKDPLVRRTARTSSFSLATTSVTASRLEKLGARRIQVCGESALASEDIQRLTNMRLEKGPSIRFISMGRLLHWKGFHIGLRAFAQSGLLNTEYWIIGDGPERHRLEQLALQSQVGTRVRFWGNLPRNEALAKLAMCHVLVHPSLHDSGGWVCLEAMAAGRPVICLDQGGPATQVTSESGVKIRVESPEQVIADIADAMAMFANSSDLCHTMGQSGRERVSTMFTWDHKATIFNKIYAEALSR